MGERILIAGCGFVGSQLARELRRGGHEVWGLSRSQPDLPDGAHWVAADLTSPASLAQLPAVDYLVYCASAGESTDERYRAVYVEGLSNLVRAYRDRAPKRLAFVSSTAVYHQTDGSWVDEESPTHPSHFAGKRTLEAEAVAIASPIPAVVLRCAGIYGPGRTRLIDSVRNGTARWAEGTTRFTNRIHRDDVAGALAHLLFHAAPQSIYVGVDEDPAAERDVFAFLAERLGVEEPPAGPAEGGHRLTGNKRCSGARLRASGYEFRFPSFRQGYSAMLERGA
jgi:nucleoside-diphosphate-sugar epimerase